MSYLKIISLDPSSQVIPDSLRLTIETENVETVFLELTKYLNQPELLAAIQDVYPGLISYFLRMPAIKEHLRNTSVPIDSPSPVVGEIPPELQSELAALEHMSQDSKSGVTALLYAYYSIAEEANPTWRPTMEDRYLAGTAVDGTTILAVFDGHGGEAVAEFAQKHFIKVYNLERVTAPTMKEAIRRTFLKLDRKILKHITDNSGSTAAVLFIRGTEVYAANIGDARILRFTECSQPPQQLTVDHNLHDESEKVRVAGKIFCVNGRVGGQLAVSRAFGDKELKEGVIAKPYIQKIENVRPGDQFVISCDGLYERNGGALPIEAVQERIQNLRLSDLGFAAHELIEMAKENGTRDNVTVMTVCIKNPVMPLSPPKAAPSREKQHKPPKKRPAISGPTQRRADLPQKNDVIKRMVADARQGAATRIAEIQTEDLFDPRQNFMYAYGELAEREKQVKKDIAEGLKSEEDLCNFRRGGLLYVHLNSALEEINRQDLNDRRCTAYTDLLTELQLLKRNRLGIAAAPVASYGDRRGQ